MHDQEKGIYMSEPNKIVEKTQEERLHEATQYVERAKVEQVDSVEQQCIDGRTESSDLLSADDKKEVMLRPAGAAGWSLILLALGYTPDLAYRSVFDFLQTKNMRYGWHTDDHSQHGNPEDEVVGTSTTHRSISLSGNHGESFVLVNKSIDWSILPMVGTDSAFVYDQVLDEKLLAEFVEWFNHSSHVGEQPLDFDTVKQVRNQQDTATLRLLAFDKDVFEVDFDETGKPFLKLASTIEPYTEEEVSEIRSNNLLGITGCGHLQRAINYAKAYNVTKDEIIVTQEKIITLYRLIQQESMSSENWTSE